MVHEVAGHEVVDNGQVGLVLELFFEPSNRFSGGLVLTGGNRLVTSSHLPGKLGRVALAILTPNHLRPGVRPFRPWRLLLGAGNLTTLRAAASRRGRRKQEVADA